MRIHLDTDFGGDPDDVCALAMLLGWPGVELTGITTTIDPGGWRAAYVEHCLALVGRAGVPVVAGTEVSLTTGRIAAPFLDDARYWPLDLRPRPAPPGAAGALLLQSIERGATIAGIGPATNLAQLEERRPGTLARASVVLMGGWVAPPVHGLPSWGPDMDFNVQWDTRAAEMVVAAAGSLALVPLAVTLRAPLRARDLSRLHAAGPLGALLARQSETYGQDQGMAALGRAHSGLPDDLVNFHHDPVAVAVALAWPGVTVEDQRLEPVRDGEILRFQPGETGWLIRVARDIDGEAFSAAWMAAVEAAHGLS